jgi:sulfoquinovosyltransferase
MKQEFEEHGVQRVAVWSKGIDTEVFHPKYGAKPWWTAAHPEADKAEAAELLDGAKAMRARLTDGSPESPLLIYVGRLGTEKRLRDLKAVLERLPEARLAIVGKGPDMEPLQAHFAGTSTLFTGLLSGIELSQAFAAADVFVMPSDSETLGFVVLESMASGVPVVGCNAGGIPSIIDQVARRRALGRIPPAAPLPLCPPALLCPPPLPPCPPAPCPLLTAPLSTAHRTRRAFSSRQATRSSWRATWSSSS